MNGGATVLSPRIARTILRVLKLVVPRSTVPLGTVLRLRGYTAGDNPLAVSDEARGSAESLDDPFLREVLRDHELGTWSLPPDGINLLQRIMRQVAPHTVLEFGSGVSTLCLAHFMTELPRDRPGSPTVFSIEQDPHYAERTKRLLGSVGLADEVRVITARLTARDVAGRSMSVYDITPEELENELLGRQIDLVLVDGPSAEPGARYVTLPLAQGSLAPRATIVLDDALRDGELEAADRWRRELSFESIGLNLGGHGILLGTMVEGDK